MADYVIIESRDPGATFGDTEFTDWLLGLRALGHTATVFLTQNAVIAARKGCVYNAGLKTLVDAEVRVVADDFYALEKNIDALADGLTAGSMDDLVDHLMTPGVRAVWH